MLKYYAMMGTAWVALLFTLLLLASITGNHWEIAPVASIGFLFIAQGIHDLYFRQAYAEAYRRSWRMLEQATPVTLLFLVVFRIACLLAMGMFMVLATTVLIRQP